jgi:hypothetical protein
MFGSPMVTWMIVKKTERSSHRSNQLHSYMIEIVLVVYRVTV